MTIIAILGGLSSMLLLLPMAFLTLLDNEGVSS